MKVEPTRKCFDDAIEMLEAMVKADPSIAFSSEVLLFHGMGLEPINGKPFAHAWLEWDGKVLFRVLCDGAPIEAEGDPAELRQFLRIYQETPYTPREVWAHNARTGHFGPWEEPYISHCSKRRDQHETA